MNLDNVHHHSYRDSRDAVTARAYRLILAYLDTDENTSLATDLRRAQDAVTTLDDQLGGCPECWAAVAMLCASTAAEHMAEHLGDDDAIQYVCDRIDDAVT